MTDHWLHHRLMRKRKAPTFRKYWAVNNDRTISLDTLKDAIAFAHRKIEWSKVNMDKVIVTDEGVGFLTSVKEPTKWQRFVDAWTGK